MCTNYSRKHWIGFSVSKKVDFEEMLNHAVSDGEDTRIRLKFRRVRGRGRINSSVKCTNHGTKYIACSLGDLTQFC